MEESLDSSSPAEQAGVVQRRLVEVPLQAADRHGELRLILHQGVHRALLH